MNPLVIIQVTRQGPGWTPINYMADLAGRLFGTETVTLPKTRANLAKVRFGLQKRKRNAEKPDLLLIAPTPSDLLMLAEVDGWQEGFNRAAAWIVDSFWLDRVPRFGAADKFDHLFIMTGNEKEAFERRLKRPTTFLPWGADVLDQGLGQAGSQGDGKSIDLLRMGRQPLSLGNDVENARASQELGMSYQGRPPFADDTITLHRQNMATYRKTKFVLASSNRAAPVEFTHPKREYVTGRWTDALAAGCVVAGIPPHSDMTCQEYLWPEALLEFPNVDRGQALSTIREALDHWTLELAQQNYRTALERLDWRWRFQEIADYFGHDFPLLEQDLAWLRQTLDNSLEPVPAELAL